MWSSRELKDVWKLQVEVSRRRSKMMDEIERRKYYEGFNLGREKKMFQEELQDLEITYKATLLNLHKRVEDVLPSLLHYMEEFITLHKQNEAVREKLDGLLAKMGRGSEEQEEDDE